MEAEKTNRVPDQAHDVRRVFHSLEEAMAWLKEGTTAAPQPMKPQEH